MSRLNNIYGEKNISKFKNVATIEQQKYIP